jgi:hypothetical protein
MSIYETVKAELGPAPAYPRKPDFTSVYGYAKGQTRRVDPRSAESLLKAKVVKRADEPDPAPEDPEVPDIPASKDLTPPE